MLLHAVKEDPRENSALTDIFKAYRKFSGLSGMIKIGIGRAKGESLDVVEVNNLLAELGEYESVVSAKIKIRDDAAARIEVVDLLDECFSDIITYNLRPRQTLGFETAALNMIGRYKKAKEKIMALITIPN